MTKEIKNEEFTKLVQAKMLEKGTKTSLGEVAKFNNAYEEVIVEQLLKGNKVPRSGFVKFDIKAKEERNARNPKTGDTVVVPAHLSASAKLSDTVKNAVKQATTA